MRKLFGAEHCNVQPYSGSPANRAVYFAFCKPGDVVMGLGLPAGGHLTHGWGVSITGSYFKSVAYGVRKDDHRIDMDQVRALAGRLDVVPQIHGIDLPPQAQRDVARFGIAQRGVAVEV
jgi:glycine/serine hydroxymethyltransferase